VVNILYIERYATMAINMIASLLAGLSKLGVIKNNIKIHNIFRKRKRSNKYADDLPRNRNVFIKKISK
jgi:hypothetical protein